MKVQPPFLLAAGCLVLNGLGHLLGLALLAFVGLLAGHWLAGSPPPTALGIGISLCGLALPLARYLDRLASHKLTFNVLGQLRQTVLTGLAPNAWHLLNQYRSGDLVKRLTADVDQLDRLWLGAWLPLFGAALTGLFFVAGTGFVSGILALAWIVIMGLQASILHVISRLGMAQSAQQVELASHMDTARTEHYRTWMVKRLHNRPADTAPEMALEACIERQQAWQQKCQLALLGLWALGLCFSVWQLPHVVAQQGLPIACACLMASLKLAEILPPLTGVGQALGASMAAQDRINDLLVPASTAAGHADFKGQAVPALHLRQVSARWPGSPALLLDNINLDLPPGSWTGIQGDSGSGKSSLGLLMNGVLLAEQGEVLIGASPLNTLSTRARHQQVILGRQTPFLLNDSLRENLRLADAQASDAILSALLDALELHPGGLRGLERLNVWCGAGGLHLSHGELRRLELARLILCKAPILVLDEPTEGLPADSEQRVMRLLKHRLQGRSLVLISHRKAPLTYCDRVLKLEHGRLEPVPTPDVPLCSTSQAD
jgi:ATP-binding cassette subfamily C protein CydC